MSGNPCRGAGVSDMGDMKKKNPTNKVFCEKSEDLPEGGEPSSRHGFPIALWLLVFFTAVSLSGIQVANYVEKYLEKPTRTRFLIREQEDWKLPQLIFCRHIPHEIERTKDSNGMEMIQLGKSNPNKEELINFQLIYENERNLTEFMEKVTPKVSEIFQSIKLGISDEEKIRKIPGNVGPLDIATPDIGSWALSALQGVNNASKSVGVQPCRGQPCVCHTLLLNASLGKGHREGIHFHLKGSCEWALNEYHRYDLFFLDPREKLSNINGIPFSFEKVELPPLPGVLNIQLDPKVVKIVDTPRHHCSQDPQHSFVQCTEECLLRSLNVTCSGPWMNFKPTCTNEKDFQNFTEEFTTLVRLKTKEYESLGCKCPERCQVSQYRPTTMRDNVQFSYQSTLVNIFLAYLEEEVREEQESYDILQMLGELGGILGMLLGLSLLSLYEILEEIVLRIKRFRKKGVWRRNEKTGRRGLRRYLWFSMVFIAMGLSITEVVAYVQKYMEGPIDTLHTLVEEDELPFPRITICPDPWYDSAKLKKRNISYSNDTILVNPNDTLPIQEEEDLEKILEDISISAWQTVTQYKIGRSDEMNATYVNATGVNNVLTSELGDWTTTWLQTRGKKFQPGPCHTLTPRVTLSKGYDEGLLLHLQIVPKLTPEGLPIEWSSYVPHPFHTIHFTDRHEKVTEFQRIQSKSELVVLNSVHLQQDIKLRPVRMISLNTPKSPCSDDPSYSYVQCMEDCLMLSLESQCVGPWLNVSMKPLCRKAEEYTKFIQEYEDLVRRRNVSSCSKRCPLRCRSTWFRPSLDLQIDTSPHLIPNIALNIYFPSIAVEILEEQWSYDILELLGELGGGLGITLGISLLTLYDLMEMFVAILLSR